MQQKYNVIEIFTDGACRGNPGPGGWGAILRYNKTEKYLNGAESLTTNNRMELTAVIKALEALKKSCAIKITTDSQYVRKGITEWLIQWKKRNWLTINKEPVKNIELWKQLDKITKQHEISWHWVKGHSGHRENELADQLANKAINNLIGKN